MPQPVAVAQQPAQGISNIGFQRGSQGEGQVLIDFLNPNTPADVQQQGSKVIVRMLGNKIPSHLIRRLNMNDFATPVSTVDAYNEGGNGIITIQSTGSYEYMAYQTENRLTVSLKRRKKRVRSKPVLHLIIAVKRFHSTFRILRFVGYYSC